jgi:hypothetical protein
MTDAGSLPLALSDVVAGLRRSGALVGTVTAGNAFGGDREAVTLVSALEVAMAEWEPAAIVVGTGPGVVGTGSRHGFSGLEVATIVDLVGRAGGRPVVALRVSDADPRSRHRGVSHHTLTALEYAHERAVVAIPRGEAVLELADHDSMVVGVPDMAALLAEQGLEVTTMGRGPDDDPRFFAYAGAAGVAAATLCGLASR